MPLTMPKKMSEFADAFADRVPAAQGTIPPATWARE
jgi:hypothetical protein